MFFESYNSTDFEGMTGLGDSMSRGALFSTFKNGLTSGFYTISDAEINSIIDAVLSTYRISNDNVNLDQNTLDSIDSDITNDVVSVLGKAKALAYKGQISDIVNGLKRSGYQAIPLSYSASSRSSSIAAQGAQAAQSFGSPSIVNSIAATVENTFPDLYVTRPYRQTPADKQRLMWIIGGFGLMFTVAIAVIAARD